jgi:hypothetical protein
MFWIGGVRAGRTLGRSVRDCYFSFRHFCPLVLVRYCVLCSHNAHWSVDMANTRTRITTTVRHDNPVPRRRKKKSDATVIAVIVLLALAFLFARTSQHGGVQHARPASVSR